jgi:GAF domain-containing protein
VDPPVLPTAALPLTDELSAVSARMSGLLLSRETVTSALSLITSVAVETMPGAVGAGVTILDEQGRRTSAATDPRVERADALQYEYDEGPCLAAVALRQLVRVDDVAGDPRWPRWSADAAPLGLGAALSSPMMAAGDRPLGAVKVYGARARAFDDQAGRLLTLFAAQAAVLVANVQSHERAQRLSDGLRRAVHERDAVSVAKGVLMARHGVDEETAFSMLLARAAQDETPLVEAARAVAHSALRQRR